MVEDFPAPFGPRKPKASPRSRSKSIPSTAVKLPNLFVRPVGADETSGIGRHSSDTTGRVRTMPNEYFPRRLTREYGVSGHIHPGLPVLHRQHMVSPRQDRV